VTKKKRRKKKKGISAAATALLAISLILTILVAISIAGVMYFGSVLQSSTTTLPNVYAGQIDLGSKTYEEVLEALDEGGWLDAFTGNLHVTLPLGADFDIDYEAAGACPDPKLTADAAMRLGHSGSWIDCIKAYVSSRSTKVDVGNTDREIDREYVEQLAAAAVEKFEHLNGDSDFVLDKENHTITLIKGAGEFTLDVQKITDAAVEAIENGVSSIEYSELIGTATMPDFSRLHDELCVEGSDAYYDPENNEVIREIYGIDFDVEQAQQLWQSADILGDITLPVELYEPKVTAEQLKSVLFRDLLGEQTTNYWGSNDNRICNIGFAAQIINGTILQPGDVFSFNETVGQRTEERGFKTAGAYSDGAVIQEVGGGICQVSSTIYAATLRANLETVDRRCHTFTVSYLPMGIDATVSWPNCDYKFRNDTDYPIKLIVTTNYDERSITCQIWGTNVTGNYCEPKSAWWPVYDTVYTSTQVGWGANCYRWIYDKDGNLLDKVFERNSSYDLHKEDIQWPDEYYADQNGGGGDTGGDTGGDVVISDPVPEQTETPIGQDPLPVG